MTDIRQRENESLLDYQVRLYRNKEDYNLSNVEIGMLLNEASGLCHDESNWRKYTTAYIDGYDDAIEKEDSSSEYIDELKEAKQELYKERVRNQDSLRQLRGLLRDSAREENLKETIVEELRQYDKPIEPLKINLSKNENRIGTLLLSDWHYGDYVDDFTNEYNDEIFQRRIDKLIAEVIKHIKMYELDELLVLNLGDLISGSIHVSTRVIEEKDIIGQTIEVAKAVEKILISISQYVSKIDYYSVTDNHSRANKNKKEHIEKENFNRIIDYILETRFRDDKTVNIKHSKIGSYEDLEIGVVEVFNETILFVHGHHDKPNTIVADLSLMTKKFPIAIFMGHLHKNYRDEVNEIDLIMSPSLMGANEYSKSIRKTSKPSQKFIVFENDNESTYIAGEHAFYLGDC